jgi:hypothetical protein
MRYFETTPFNKDYEMVERRSSAKNLQTVV